VRKDALRASTHVLLTTRRNRAEPLLRGANAFASAFSREEETTNQSDRERVRTVLRYKRTTGKRQESAAEAVGSAARRQVANAEEQNRDPEGDSTGR